MSDENGQTPLYAACIGDHTDIIKLLNDSGYNVNHQGKDGKTPLYIAFENHTPYLAQTLITQFKANTEVRDKQNWTPLHTTVDKGYYSYSPQLAEKFLQQDLGTDVSWIQLHAACFEDGVQSVQILLDADTNVNHVSSTGYTPLHIAVTKSNIDIVTLLLERDVNIHSMTIDGKTPLHIAADKGDEIIIHKLLAQKADPNLKDAIGNTSLHVAVELKREVKPGLQKARKGLDNGIRSVLPPGQFPPDSCPPPIPPWTIPPRTIPPWSISPQDNSPLGQLPPRIIAPWTVAPCAFPPLGQFPLQPLFLCLDKKQIILSAC